MTHHATNGLLAVVLAGLPFMSAPAQQRTPHPVVGVRPLSLVRNGGLEADGAWSLHEGAIVASGRTGRGLGLETLGSAVQEVRAPGPGTILTVDVDSKTADVLGQSAEGQPVLVRNRVGQGAV